MVGIQAQMQTNVTVWLDINLLHPKYTKIAMTQNIGPSPGGPVDEQQEIVNTTICMLKVFDEAPCHFHHCGDTGLHCICPLSQSHLE